MSLARLFLLFKFVTKHYRIPLVMFLAFSWPSMVLAQAFDPKAVVWCNGVRYYGKCPSSSSPSSNAYAPGGGAAGALGAGAHALGEGLGRAFIEMLFSGFGQNNPARQEAQRQEAERQEAAERARRAEEQARREEQHQRLIGNLRREGSSAFSGSAATNIRRGDPDGGIALDQLRRAAGDFRPNIPLATPKPVQGLTLIDLTRPGPKPREEVSALLGDAVQNARYAEEGSKERIARLEQESVRDEAKIREERDMLGRIENEREKLEQMKEEVDKSLEETVDLTIQLPEVIPGAERTN